MKTEKNTTPLRTALIYALFGILWILLSDTAVELLNPPGSTIYGLMQTIKGWIFVLVSACLIYFIVRNDMRSLRESEERYRLLFESSLDAVLLTTPDGDIHAANPAACLMFGRTEEDIKQVGRDGLVDTSDPRLQPALEERARTGQYFGELTFLRKDGTKFPGEISSPLFKDRHGHDQTSMVIRDITGRKRAEEVLRASEKHFRALIEHGRDNISLLTADGILLWESPAIFRTLGYEHDQFKGQSMFDLIHPDDLGWIQLRFKEILSQRGGTTQGSFRLRHSDGSWRWVEGTSTNLLHEPSVNAIVINYRDITERKEAEEALAHSEQAYRTLFENLPIGLYRTSADGVFLDANPALARMFGYTERESLLGRNVVDFYVDPADDERFRREIENVNTISNFEAEYRRADGTTLWTEDHIRAVRDEAERMLFYEGSLIDITERKQAEKATQYYTNQLKAVNAAAARLQKLYSPQVLANEVIKTLEDILHYTYGAVLLIEESGERLSTFALGTEGRKEEEAAALKGGLDRQEIRPGRGIIGWVAQTGEKVRVGDVRHDKRYLAVRENIRSELCVPLKAGESIIGVVNVESVRPDAYSETDESVLETVAAQISVAIQNARLFEQVRQQSAELEQRVQERTAELVRANRAKDEFLANMSHELRTPLNGIMGFAEMLMQGTRGPVSEKQAQDLGIIHSSGQHLLGLINDILDISKIEAGNFELHSEVVPLNSVCQSSLAFIRQLAQKKSITVEYLPAAPAAMIFADPKRLKQILVNLLNNAVKFTPERGNIKLEVREDIEASQVQFSVTDNGIGIAPENLQKLFEPFVQLDSSLSRQHEGTGLGLSLVKKLVELHGGSVEVESELDRGSCFRVNIPIRLQNVTGRDVQEIIDRDLLGKTAPLVPGAKNKRILITEDNPINMMVTSDFLTSKGHEVIEAKNGMEAIEKAREQKPALILMDIQMPDMNGFETIKRLRELPEFGSTPIIALTALAMPGDRERCLEAGANEYLTKPVSLKTLAELIENLLQRGDHR
ncbi:MAG: PAS domain S-box protein [Chloroflexi bacterium]|nr:PAS domain S-box protein [Chloroflexota bacterium]